MKIRYLDGARLRRALISGCDFVQRRRAELNRINVFPVPDGDTGTNLALTTSAIADRLRASRERSLAVVAREAAESAIMGARGNCGMILSHFLQGFAQAVGERVHLHAQEFAGCLQGAVGHVYGALEHPVEGTIITVMRETARSAQGAVTRDFAELLELLLDRAQDAVARTMDMLPALKAAGVVDAGAKGFVHILEGMVSYVHGDPFVALAAAPVYEAVAPAAARASYPAANERFRYCTEALVGGPVLPLADEVRSALRELGDSLIVIRGEQVLKIHIHTDAPELVFAYLARHGEVVTHKAEDMTVQFHAVARAAAAHVQLARRPITIVTDSACNLPEEIIRAHGIHVVPLSLVFPGEVLREGLDIDADTFVTRLRNGEQATTSQPPPAAFLEAFRRASEDGETILAVILASALSGTYHAAEAAARQLPELSIRLVDSRAASLLQGLQVLRAAELAEKGQPPEAIVRELRAIRDRSALYFTVDTYDRLLASGRVGRGRVLVADLLDIRPILGVSSDGRVAPLARVRGKQNVLPRMLELMAGQIPAHPEGLRFGIVHVGAPAIVPVIREALRQRFGTHETIVAPASPVLATHLGPGAWGLGFQLDGGGPAPGPAPASDA